MNLQQLIAQAITACANLGAELGGFLGTLSQAELQARMDTRPEAEQLLTDIASNYSPCQEKTDAMEAVQDVIEAFPGGG